MKTVSTALKAHLASETQTVCTCWLTKQVGGTVLAFTDHDQDITFNLETALTTLGLPTPPEFVGSGSKVYAAATGFTASDIQSGSGLNVDTGEAIGVLVSPAITEADMLAGLWDHAAIVIFQVNWSDLTMGPLLERVGHLGEISTERGHFQAEWRGLLNAYADNIGELTSPFCSAILGDARCTKNLAAFTVTGSLDAVDADNMTVHDSERAEAGAVAATDTTPAVAGYFDFGIMTMTSGPNNGISREVKTYAPGVWTLWLPMPYPMSRYETYSMVAGCSHSRTVCKTRFNNIVNFRGFPDLPGIDKMIQVGRHQ